MSRKPGKLLLKILKAEVHAERMRVLQKKFSCLRDLRGRLRLHQSQARDGPRYPMSMPPFTLST